MEVIKIEPGVKYDDEVNKRLDKGEVVLHKFEVVPLDIRVSDYLSPIFYITSTRLFFLSDDLLEIYNLSELTIDIVGEEPHFEIAKLLLEVYPNYHYDFNKEIDKMKLKEGLTKLSLNEEKQVPKYFLLRNSHNIQKSYKTWAIYQLLLNLKNGVNKNEVLLEMLSGFFTKFNQKTVLIFIVVFIVYVLLRIISLLLLPTIVGTIFDVIFSFVLVLLGYWLYLSSNKNFQRYYRYYLNHMNN